MNKHAVPVIESGYRCESGAERERNEDACLALTTEFGGYFAMQPMGLYVVADGMGGEREGHVASNAATRAFAEFVLINLYFPLLNNRPAPREADVVDLMERAVFAAHDAVYQPSPDGSASSGGTTLTAALILGRRLCVAHVGDTRAYLLTDGELKPLTEDHSLVRRLQETGRLSAEEAPNFQYRNVLLRALGQAGALTADTVALEMPDAGKLLLCSDGLCGLVSVEEMERILHGEGTAQQLADRLYMAAMNAGGHDNITALVVEFEF